MKCVIKDYKVNELPSKGEPNSRYYIPNGQGSNIDEYVTDKDGNFRKVSSQSNYIHTQDVAENVWLVNHNLGYYPSVSVVDSSGKIVIGQVEYLNPNHIKITFSAGFSGKAYLS